MTDIRYQSDPLMENDAAYTGEPSRSAGMNCSFCFNCSNNEWGIWGMELESRSSFISIGSPEAFIKKLISPWIKCVCVISCCRELREK